MALTDYMSNSGGGGSLFGDVMSSDSLSDTATSQTWLGDAWEGTTGFLEDGLNIYKDYLTVTGQNRPYEIPAGMSYDQFSEQYKPANTQAPTTARPTSSGGQWVPGIDNAVLLLGGAAVALFLMK